MASIYVERLIKRVIELSQSSDWDTAVAEWEIADCEEDDTLSESCVCGKEHLYYLFTIENAINGNTLFPIGSSCIKKFGRDDLDDEAAVREKMFKLYHAVEDNHFISLSPEFFSRKLLKKLYDEGAFDCEYNGYDGYDDYEFRLPQPPIPAFRSSFPAYPAGWQYWRSPRQGHRLWKACNRWPPGSCPPELRPCLCIRIRSS